MRSPWRWLKEERRRAAAARAEAVAERDRVRSQMPEIRELAHALVEVQRRNHLGEHLSEIMRGKQ